MLSAKSTKEAFRFVAYLDLLGMSALSLKDPECAIGVLVAFDEIVSQTSKMAVVKVKHKKPLSHPITWTFSDSVVIVTQGDSDADWWAIVSVTTTLFLMALSRVIPLSTKGAFYILVITTPRALIMVPKNMIFYYSSSLSRIYDEISIVNGAILMD